MFRSSNFSVFAALCGVAAFALSSSGCRAQEIDGAPATAATSGAALFNKAPIGVGLEGLADWSRAQMFADAMKTSRAWGLPEKPWVHEIQTDALGWPLEDAGVVVIADTPDIGGTYALAFEGRAQVEGTFGVEIQNLNYDGAANLSTAQVVVPAAATQIFLKFTGTQGGVKNVRLMRPGTTEKDIFSPAFVDKLKPFPVLRFMDYLSTNNNKVVQWADRTTPETSSQARAQGGALEYVVELANLTGKDIWVNVPASADENYARQMAQLLKNGLIKNQKVYVEWSNEVWNWQFQQAQDNLAQAKIEGNAADAPLAFDQDRNEGYWAMRRIAKRSAEVGQIFRDVFGDTDMSRVRPIYATQVGYEEVYKQGFYFLEHQYGQPNQVFYALAGAPYFNLNEEENKRGDITPDEIFAVLPQRIDETLNMANTLGSYATYYGLKHLAYEGGQHLQDHEGNGSTEAKIAVNRDPRMGPLVEKYLDGWQALNGDLFEYFTLSSGYSKWGSWGLLENMNATSPKYDAVTKVINSPAVPITVGALLPATIAAGDFVASNHWDKKGSASINIEPNKWMHYQVRAPKTATYNLALDATGNGEAEVLVNAKSAGTMRADGTLAVPINAGLNIIRIKGTQQRFELKSLHVMVP